MLETSEHFWQYFAFFISFILFPICFSRIDYKSLAKGI